MNELCHALGNLKAGSEKGVGAAGLLFGTVEQDFVNVERCKPFSASITESRRDYLDRAFEPLLATTKVDPEFTSLQLIGWYSVHDCVDMPRLLDREVEFHNRRFRRVTDLAVVLKPHQPAGISIEVCSRLSLNTPISTQDFRSGSLRLGVHGRVDDGAIHVTMRPPVGDDCYLRVFQVLDSLDRAEKRQSWKKIVLSAKRIAPPALRPNWLKSGDTNQLGIVTSASPDSSRRAAGATPAVLALRSSESPMNGFSVHATPAAQFPASKTPLNDSTGLPTSVRVAPGQNLPWIALATLFLLGGGVSFAFLYSRQQRSQPGTNAPLQGTHVSTRLGLRVESQDSKSLLVRWNAHSDAVRLARGGVLHIDDGSRHRKLQLDPSQIANGSILYEPTSKDVIFRLEIFDTARMPTSETVRVVDGSKDIFNADASLRSRSRTQGGVAPSGKGRQAVRVSATKPERSPAVLVTTKKPSNSTLRAGQQALPGGKRDSAVAIDAGIVSALPAVTPPAHPVANSETKNALGHSRSREVLKPERPPASTQNIATVKRNQSPGTLPRAAMDSNSSELTKPGRITQNLPPAGTPLRSIGSTAGKATGAEPAPTYVPARPLKQVMPDTSVFGYSPVRKSSDVEVEVRIDDGGRVAAAHIVQNGSNDNQLLANAALAAAKEWLFEPAQVRGKKVASDHAIKFHFRAQ